MYQLAWILELFSSLAIAFLLSELGDSDDARLFLGRPCPGWPSRTLRRKRARVLLCCLAFPFLAALSFWVARQHIMTRQSEMLRVFIVASSFALLAYFDVRLRLGPSFSHRKFALAALWAVLRVVLWIPILAIGIAATFLVLGVALEHRSIDPQVLNAPIYAGVLYVLVRALQPSPPKLSGSLCKSYTHVRAIGADMGRSSPCT